MCCGGRHRKQMRRQESITGSMLVQRGRTLSIQHLQERPGTGNAVNALNNDVTTGDVQRTPVSRRQKPVFWKIEPKAATAERPIVGGPNSAEQQFVVSDQEHNEMIEMVEHSQSIGLEV